MNVMKRLCVPVLALLLCGATHAVAQLPSNELEGSWVMISQELVYPDSVVDQSDQWGDGYKILNSTHFAWGRETKDGEEVLAGGGWYEYDPENDIYIEHIEYHSAPELNGISIEFTARVEGDTWYHIGVLQNYKLREVWKRVDPHTVGQSPSSSASAEQDTTSGGAAAADSEQ